MSQDEPLPTYPLSSPCERDKETMENDLVHIHAPYNFVPLNDWVHCPEWGNQVSHDIPFKDGLSGTIEYTLTADSPLLVGGKQKTGSKDVYGEVCFTRSPNGEYFIPGSSIRGMLRSVVEIASFGRMRMVDDARYGFRDIAKSGTTPYTDRVRNKVETGFLRRTQDGKLEIIPCEMARLDHRKIEHWWNQKKPLFRPGSNVRSKYSFWKNLCYKNKINKWQIPFDLIQAKNEKIVTGINKRSKKKGVPVFTGQISNDKYKDFIFFDKKNESIEIEVEDWRNFLLIHGDDENDKSVMPWPGFWRRRFNQGKEIPVFYVKREGKGVSIALAYMPKLAWDYSIKQMIGHTHEDHNQDPENGYGYDMADLLFGTLGDKPEKHLKGRVNCGMLKAKDHPIPKETKPTILNTPKPTYYPNYLQQPAVNGRLKPGEVFNTGLGGGSSRPEIRGFKRYPARIEDKVGTQPLTREQERGSKATQVVLYPLPEETQFKGQISFHNLCPVELGALLWAMTWGNNQEMRHGLGMGKPFGYGQVQLNITNSHARKNIAPGEQENIDIDQYLTEYTQHMQNKYGKAKNSAEWIESKQMQNLLAMADPGRSNNIENTNCFDLRHMCLTMRGGNEFLIAKQSELVLRDYPSATKPYDSPKTPVLKDIFDEINKEEEGHNNCDLNKIWGQKRLLQEWRKISDVTAKQEALEEIRQYWIKQGWWNSGVRTKKKIQAIYECG